MEGKEKEHLLALKVMRLTKPTVCTSFPLTSNCNDLVHEQLENMSKNDISLAPDLSNFSSGNLLMLPQSFGNIYLGETFSCYMSVHNNSQIIVRNVSVQADLQVGPQKLMLISPNAECSLIQALKPGTSVDVVINHEVKEIGTHILACTVSYMNENEEKTHFRKFFKFQVSKPLDIKTKFYNAETDEVYLEAQLQNITCSSMCLEKVSLEPSINFSSQQLNTVGPSNSPVFGSVNCLNPYESRQYLFCLSPRQKPDRNVKAVKGVTSIGKLDIVWRTTMGEKGRLQTSQLERMAPGHGDLKVTVENIPNVVLLGKAFSVSCKVANTSERILSLKVSLHNRFSSGLLWQGVSGHDIGKIRPSSSAVLHFDAVPIKTGLLYISGISLTDTFLMRTYDYDDLEQICVTSDSVK